MPQCASQIYLCDLPIRFDTYVGCSHGCKYCFAKAFKDISDVGLGETPLQLKNFISGKRTSVTKWCDWDIPLHWGGMSDPFQPCEEIYKNSYECLNLLAESKYPFVVSTKGSLVADDKYLDLLEKCNCVVQISMVCSKYDVLEQGCPSFDERLEMLSKVSKRVQRTIVRVQPYMHEVFDDVYNNLEKFKQAGAYGVVIEGMKFRKSKKGLVKLAGDFVYPYDLIKSDFMKLKKRAHELGLKIYAGENRLRIYGDSLTCCGIDGLEGFKPNTYNLNHILNGDEGVEPTQAMLLKGSGDVFKGLFQDTMHSKKFRSQTYAYSLHEVYDLKKITIDKTFGLNERK